MSFLGPNDFLVSQKNDGKVLRVLNGTLLSKPLIDVKVANQYERGLLGLAISKCIIEMHGGRIWVDSVVGRGSTFFVTLPVLVRAQADVAADGTPIT